MQSQADAARRRLRICFIVESGTDVRLADGLAERTDLTIVARRIEGGVEISQPPRRQFAIVIGPSSPVRFARFVYSFLRRAAPRFDFVILQGYGVAALAGNLALRSSGTASAMLVCSPVEEYYACRRGQTGFGKPYRRYEHAALRLAARANARISGRYIALSEYLARIVRSHGPGADVQVIPVYGVDTGVFRPAQQPVTELRRARGLPETGSIVFFSSRVAPEKDSDTLLRAFERLRADRRDVYLLHRSGGFERFAAAAVRYGISDRVIATGAVHPHDELPLDYAACDVCVQASRAEGLGYSVLEAMACAVPVVATAVGGLVETVVDGTTGWTCPPQDAAALQARIGEVLDNPCEARRRADAALRMVRERYDSAVVFDRLMAGMTAAQN
jgi:glycosyltransferase involved in cell wall biosynthesis